MSRDEPTESVKSFFESYANAFAEFDAVRIAEFYHDPTMTLRADGSLHFLSGREKIVSFFQTVLDNAYRPFQFSHGLIHELEIKPLGGRSALATMQWDLRRADETVIRRWRQSYNILRAASGWRIIVSTFHID